MNYFNISVITLSAIVIGVFVISIPIMADQSKELPNPNVSIHMDYEEIRNDGVVVIHYSDGSKLFKATMEDGIDATSASLHTEKTHIP